MPEKKEFKVGDQIVYMPDHAHGITHEDAEFGFVTSVENQETLGTVFCRYWRKNNLEVLRTTANSESTPIRNLELYSCRNQGVIDDLLKQLGYTK